MNYLTQPELLNVIEILEFFKNKSDADEFYLGVEVKLFDINGEFVGTVKIVDGGEYSFVPEQEDG